MAAKAGVNYAQANSVKSASSRPARQQPRKPLGTDDIFEQEIEMPRNIYVVLFVLIMIVVAVSIDLLFFQESILGTADGEYRHCFGFYSLLFEIPKESVN